MYINNTCAQNLVRSLKIVACAQATDSHILVECSRVYVCVANLYGELFSLHVRSIYIGCGWFVCSYHSNDS